MLHSIFLFNYSSNICSLSPPAVSLVATLYTTVVSPAVEEAVILRRCLEAEVRSHTPKSVVSLFTWEWSGVQPILTLSLPNSTYFVYRQGVCIWKDKSDQEFEEAACWRNEQDAEY